MYEKGGNMQQGCIVCGSQVGKKDKVCDNCGTPIDRTEGLRNFVGKIVIFAFFLAMIGGIAWLVKYLMF